MQMKKRVALLGNGLRLRPLDRNTSNTQYGDGKTILIRNQDTRESWRYASVCHFDLVTSSSARSFLSRQSDNVGRDSGEGKKYCRASSYYRIDLISFYVSDFFTVAKLDHLEIESLPLPRVRASVHPLC